MLVITLGNGPVDLDNVQIIENIVEEEVEDEIDIVQLDHKKWRLQWKEWEQTGMIVPDMDTIIMAVEVEEQLLGVQIIILPHIMEIITMETMVTAAGLCFVTLCYVMFMLMFFFFWTFISRISTACHEKERLHSDYAKKE